METPVPDSPREFDQTMERFTNEGRVFAHPPRQEVLALPSHCNYCSTALPEGYNAVIYESDGGGFAGSTNYCDSACLELWLDIPDETDIEDDEN